MNKFLDSRYVPVFSYKGFHICTFEIACPEKGDSLGYVIDDEYFSNQDFNWLYDAMKAIDDILT